MADEIKIASARSLINSSGDSCVRFMALTEVGAAIGGSEGDRLQRVGIDAGAEIGLGRSEEHTSELQSLMRISYAVFCLKKKNKTIYTDDNHHIQHSCKTRKSKHTAHQYAH